MKNHFMRKIVLFGGLVCSIFGVIVAAVSTAAWFQINTTKKEVVDNSTIKSGTPNLSITNSQVTGYKIQQSLGVDGFPDYSSSTVSSKIGGSYDTTNNNQASADVNFDVPADGLGYYLVKKNPGDSYKYKYNGSSYSWKFNELNNSDVNFMSIDSLTFASNEKYILRKYSFDTSTYKTLNVKVPVSSGSANLTVNTDTYEISATPGTYKVWLNKSGDTKSISLETVSDFSNANLPSLNVMANSPNVKFASPTPTITTTYKMLYFRNNPSWSNVYCHFWNNSGDLDGGWPGRKMYALNSLDNGKDLFVCQINANATTVIFHNNNGTQTANWTLSANNAYWWNNNDNKGSWSVSENTYYFVNEYGGATDYNSYFGDTPYCHASRGSSENLTGIDAWPGFVMNATNQDHVFSIKLHANATYVNFNNGNNGRQTSDISLSGNTNKFFGLAYNSSATATTMTGMWYTNLPDTTTYTIYFFDNRPSSRWNPPYAYFWYGTGAQNNTNESNYYHRAWPGVQMSPIDSSEAATLGGASTTYTWKISLSYSYNHIIFTDGSLSNSNDIQTNDLDISSSYSGQIACLDNTHTSGNKWNVSWFSSLYSVEYKISYFIDGNQLNFSSVVPGIAESTGSLKNYTHTSNLTGYTGETKSDPSNGIFYKFTRDNTARLYTNSACSSTFTDGSTTLTQTNGIITLYLKYETSSEDYKSFYVDVSKPSWSSLWLYNESTSSELFASALTPITTGLYKVHIHNSVTRVKAHITSAGGTAQNWSTEFNPNSSSGYMYVANTAGNNNRVVSWPSYRTTSATGVYLQKYNGSTWSNLLVDGVAVQLLHGDGTGNDYILENGVPLRNEDIIRIYDTNSLTAYGFDEYVSSALRDKHAYVGGSGSSVTISNLGENTTARFNFYITHNDTPSSRKLSIAMVPDYGNGYYIMEYDSTYGIENYIGAIKMDSSGYSASYDGYYCRSTSKKIFIRSYLNAVDTLCDSLTSNSLTYVYSLDGNNCIQFRETGHYNIKVTGTVIDISQYQVSDFFSLNRLESSKVSGSDDAKQQAIWDQKTAIVMEVPFTANNPYDATVQLRSVCSASYIGIRFYATNRKINEANKSYFNNINNPYDFMRGTSKATYTSSYLTDASSSNALTNTNNGFTITRNSNATYYAYILIDYRYTVLSSDLTGSIPELNFYLQLAQA